MIPHPKTVKNVTYEKSCRSAAESNGAEGCSRGCGVRTGHVLAMGAPLQRGLKKTNGTQLQGRAQAAGISLAIPLRYS